MHILCRSGRHSPSRHWRLDLLDQQVKTYCRLCGVTVIRSSQKPERTSTEMLPTTPRRPPFRLAMHLGGLVAVALLAASVAVWAGEGTHGTEKSVSAKLPPPRTAVGNKIPYPDLLASDVTLTADGRAYDGAVSETSGQED